MQPVKRTPIILLLTLLMAGCSIDKRLEALSNTIEQHYDEAKEWSQLPKRTLSWEQALAMMIEKNTSLRQAESAINQAERDGLSVYTDMIPGVSYYGYFTSSLKELTNEVNSEDFNSNVNVTFSLPTLTNVPYRVYAAKARVYAAMKAREGKERELVSKLYQAVRMREIRLKQKELEGRSALSNNSSAAAQLRDSLQEDEKYWQDIAQTLGDRSARWEILPESMPHVQWKDYGERTRRLDPLVVCQFALRLEQARLQQYSVALSYLPTINTNLYSPSLFSTYGGTYQGTFLSMEDTRLNLSISYSLDTRLNSWNTYQNSKESYENARLEIISQIADHKNKLAMLRRSVAEYDTWRQYMRRRMDYVRQSPAPTADMLIERSRLLLDMEKELLSQETKAVESEAAVVLEYGMPRK